MCNFFNKKIQCNFIDNLLVKFYIFILFFMPFIVLLYLLINYPYREIFVCNSSKCSLERCYFFSNSNIVHMSRPVKVYVHYSGGNRLKSCSLMISDYQRLFYSTYYIPNFAYRDRDLIKSDNEKIKITKYNQDISIVLIFNIALILLIIYGRISYLKKSKATLPQTSGPEK